MFFGFWSPGPFLADALLVKPPKQQGNYFSGVARDAKVYKQTSFPSNNTNHHLLSLSNSCQESHSCGIQSQFRNP